MKTKEERTALNDDALEQVTGAGFYPVAPCHTTMVQKPPLASCQEALDIPECADCPSNPKNNPYSPGIYPSDDPSSLRG